MEGTGNAAAGSPDPSLEAAALAHGLARLARRRRALGDRWVPAGQEVSRIETSPGTRTAPDAPPAAPARPEPTARPEPQARPEPSARPERPAASASPGAPARAPARGAASAGPPAAADLRARAAACPDLPALAAAVEACRACPLGSSRTRSVFADGLGERRIAFVGEAPGFHEDQRGVPFVGDAGQLLSDIIAKGMGLDRARDVYICNVLKCRPPGNRDPLPEEKALCTAWLDRQLELVDPRLVIALGRHAAGHLLGTDAPLGRLRGRVHERQGRPVVVTYHPAYLLRNPADKRACWQDIQLALRVLGLPVPGR